MLPERQFGFARLSARIFTLPAAPLAAGIVAVLTLLAGSAQAEDYRDPQGRFAFEIPNGWTAAPRGNDVVIATNGAGPFVVIEIVPGGNADRNRINAAVGQIGAQWRNFTQKEAGGKTLAGRPGFYVFFDGLNPGGVQATLRVAGTYVGDDAYVLLMSAPAAEFGRYSVAFKQIESSLAIGSGLAAPTPDRPPPLPIAGNTPPRGLQEAEGPAGGHILYAALGPPSSGGDAFRAGLRLVRDHFESLELLSGVDGANGNIRLVLFKASLRGAPVAGLVIATSDPAGGSRIGLLFDTPDRFPQSLAGMQQALKSITLQASASKLPIVSPNGRIDLQRLGEAAKSVQLTEVEMPDQTASFGLANGYQVKQSALGMFTAAGADGAIVYCGVGIPLTDPRGSTYASWQRLMAMTPNYHPEFSGLLLSYIEDPAEAWVAARRAIAQKNRSPDPRVVLTYKVPVSFPGAVGGTVGALVTGTEIVDSKPMVFAGLVMSAPPNMPLGSWVVTVDLVHAPADRAEAELPALWAMLQSLKVNQTRLAAQVSATLHGMFEQSSEAMRAQHEAFMERQQASFESSMAQARAAQDAIDRSAAAMIRYASDTRVVEYGVTGEHATIGANWADALVKSDPNFTIVPLKQYIKGVDY
jgi:hypothetical protein